MVFVSNSEIDSKDAFELIKIGITSSSLGMGLLLVPLPRVGARETTSSLDVTPIE